MLLPEVPTHGGSLVRWREWTTSILQELRERSCMGGGVTFQYWISPGVGVRIGADYFSNSKSSGPLPQNILPFYSGLMINLISGSMGSLDLVGDFGQVLNNGIDNTYFDAGLQLNSVLSSRRQFFLDVRFREDGVGTMATPWQFVTAGLGINFF